MSTRSIIAVPMDNGFRGRYCHLDGYPSHQVPVLLKIVARLGVERASEVLTREHHSWSLLTGEEAAYRGLGTYRHVPGVGSAHLDGDPGEWFDQNCPSGIFEYAYVLNTTNLTVLTASPQGFTTHARVPYEQPAGEVQPDPTRA